MSTISSLKLWKNTGYTEDSLIIPTVSGTLGTSTYTITTGINTSVSKLFNEMEIKDQNFYDLMQCSYLQIIVDMNNGTDVTVFGWIDSVELISDTAGYPATRIRWHIDYWRTYKASVTFGAGTVKRRPSNGTEPPQPFGARFKTVTSVTSLFGDSNLYWVYFTFTPQNSSGSVTYTYIACFPLKTSGVNSYIHNDTQNKNYKCPNLQDVVFGAWDESLGILPSIIKGCWISPIPPVNYTGTGTDASPFYFKNGSTTIWGAYSTNDSVTVPTGYLRITNGILIGGNYNLAFTEITTSINYTSNDTTTYIITDLNGYPCLSLPWGMHITQMAYRMVISTTSAYVQIRLNGVNSSIEGICATIPCISLETTSNSWSDYVYSGQRQYDIDNRNTQSKMAQLNGLSNAANSGAQGAMFGSISTPGSIATPLSAGLGALGAIGSIGSAMGGRAIDNYFAPKIQAQSDKLNALQLDMLLLPGAGFDFMAYGRTISMVEFTWDSYSITQRTNNISMYGVFVEEATTSCSTLINAGGPLKIENLTVTGSVPVEAKTFIRNLFERGVRLI